MIGPKEIRPSKCDSLGIHKVDPGAGCPYKTSKCSKACYALNSVRRWETACHRGTHTLQLRIELDGALWSRWSARHFAGIKFVRIATRFEALKGPADVEIVRTWALSCPETTFMVPTRAWRVIPMRRLIEERLMVLPNVRVLASIDTTTTDEEYRALCDWGWSTMGFWSRKDGPHPFNAGRAVRCPKTWDGAHGRDACRACGEQGKGCFQKSRKDIYLRLHS